MKSKSLSFSLIPLVSLSVVVTSGFAAWYFTNSPIEQKQNEIGVSVENTSDVYTRLYVWFNEDDFQTNFPNSSKNDTGDKTIKAPVFSVDQNAAYFTSPLRIRAYLIDNIDPTTNNFSLTYNFTTNDVFDSLFSLSFYQGNTLNGSTISNELGIKTAITSDTNGEKYIEFVDLFIEANYLPEVAPLNESSLSKIILAMNGTNTPLITINLVASLKDNGGN